MRKVLNNMFIMTNIHDETFHPLPFRAVRL